MSNRSRNIAGLVGPTVVAMVATAFPLVQPHLYDAQIPPVVYLSGAMMFVGGLAIAGLFLTFKAYGRDDA